MKTLSWVTVGAMGAVGLLVAAPAWAEPSGGPSAIQPATRNEELERKVMANLLTDRELKNNHIDVKVEGTTVTLKGKVDSDSERGRAAQLAQVEGIVVVHDQLEVGSQDVEEAVTDAAITTKLRAQFLVDDALRRANISVSTNNGVVTLKGAVRSTAVRAKAVDLASHSHGVKRVENQLRIATR
jgi:osmotically-inducible protein OsmY